MSKRKNRGTAMSSPEHVISPTVAPGLSGAPALEAIAGDTSNGSALADIPASNSPKQDYFVSYSANFEDVILHRIFHGRPPGFYVDVGAAHPVFENDTKHLHDAGWHGINVEPNKDFFEVLVKARTRDQNFCVALSDHAGEILYYNVIGTGLSTCDETLAQSAQAKGYEVIPRQIPVSTLGALLDQAGATAVDLLKIDVEGYEEKVLAGNDWTKYRPSVILLEATYPESPERRPTGIRADLENRGYRCRYFDGLNDFYVDTGFEVPDSVFDRPPNVFDKFKLRAVVDLEQQATALATEARDASGYAKSLEAAVADHDVELRKAVEHSSVLETELSKAVERGSLLETELEAQNVLIDHAAYYLGHCVHKTGFRIADILDHDQHRLRPAGNSESEPPQGKSAMVQTAVSTAKERFEGNFLRNATEALQAENDALKIDLAQEKFDRHRLAAAAETMRQDIIKFNRELEAAHSESEELVHTKLLLAQSEAQYAALTESIRALTDNAKAQNAALEERIRLLTDNVNEGARELASAHASQEEVRKSLATAEAQYRLAETTSAFLGQRLAAVEVQYRQAETANASLGHRLATAEAANSALEQRYRATISSTSWAITGPIRAVGRILKRIVAMLRE